MNLELSSLLCGSLLVLLPAWLLYRNAASLMKTAKMDLELASATKFSIRQEILRFSVKVGELKSEQRAFWLAMESDIRKHLHKTVESQDQSSSSLKLSMDQLSQTTLVELSEFRRKLAALDATVGNSFRMALAASKGGEIRTIHQDESQVGEERLRPFPGQGRAVAPVPWSPNPQEGFIPPPATPAPNPPQPGPPPEPQQPPQPDETPLERDSGER